MTLAKAFASLRAACDEALRAVFVLHDHVGGSSAESALLDPFEDGAVELDAALREALDAVDGVAPAAAARIDVEPAALALVRSHEAVLRASRTLTELLACDSVDALVGYGREQQGSWPRWTDDVRRALDACRKPLDDVHAALLGGWVELAERAAAGAVSVQATNIGQQVTVPAELAREGAT